MKLGTARTPPAIEIPSEDEPEDEEKKGKNKCSKIIHNPFRISFAVAIVSFLCISF